MITIINVKLNNMPNLYSIMIEKDIITKIELQDKFKTHIVNKQYYELEECHSLLDTNSNIIVDAKGEILVSPLIDVHVHSRDPGNEHKEDWNSLTQAAYKGGCIGVCDMPNTIPQTLDIDSLMLKIHKSNNSTLEKKFFVGINYNNLKFLKELLNQYDHYNICGLKIYYGDSTGDMGFADLNVLTPYLPKNLKLPICFHAEDQNIININLQIYKNFTIKNYHDFIIHSYIRSVKSSITALNKILKWAKQNPFKIHIAHISSFKELKLIQKARRIGIDISCEVTPHHIIFDYNDYNKYGSLLKVNPPIRASYQVHKLRKALAKGLIDIIATDHAPHLIDEKNTLQYSDCPSGIPSIEFFMPLIFKMAQLSNTNAFNLLKLGNINPSKRFNFKNLGKIKPNYKANFVWIKLTPPSQIKFLSKCQWSPYKQVDLPICVKACWHNGIRKYYNEHE